MGIFKFVCVLVVMGVVSLSGCSDDDVTGTPDTNNDSNLRPDPNIPTSPDPDPDPDPVSCDNGCLLGGTCRTGLTSDACGANGDVCVTCGTGEVCVGGACTSEQSECNVMTCTGCCDSAGQCQSGDQSDFCGVGGASCAACNTNSSCANGQCVSSCGPGNCDGCCDQNGQCQIGFSASACGMGGLACADCGEFNCAEGRCFIPTCEETCQGCCMGDVCVPTPSATQCGAGGSACMACSGEEICRANGTCGVVSTQRWKITVVSATVNRIWDDFFSPVDPYVYADVELPNGNIIYGYTSTRWDTNNPVWNEVVLNNLAEEAFDNGLYFEMYNENAVFDQEICTWLFSFQGALTAQGVDAPCPGDPTTILRWRIDPM